MTTPLRQLAGDRRGAVTMIVALGAAALLGMLAITVDFGSAYLESRRLQGITDAAALAAVGAPDDAPGAANATIAANGWPHPYTMALVPGSYTPDPAMTPAQRFLAGDGDAAAQVTLTSDVPTFFGAAIGAAAHITVRRTATATRADLAAFSIGSRLASVNGGTANALLSALLGTSVSLSAMDYDQLAAADVDALDFSGALRSQLHLDAASYDDTLAASATMPQALAALATALDGDGQPGAATAVGKIAAQAGSMPNIQLGSLVDLGGVGAQDSSSGTTHILVNAYDLVTAALELADGARQVRLDLGATVPGVTSTSVWLAIGERAAHSPWLAVTASGQPIIRTAQTRLYIQATIAPGAALAPLGIASLSLPVYVQLAEAQARLAAISCPGGPANASVTLSVLPGVGHASIASIDTSALASFGSEPSESAATIAHAPLLTVTGQSRVDLSSSDWQEVTFSADDIAHGTIHTVSSSGVVSAIVSSLVQHMTLHASAVGAGVNAGAATALVGSALQPAAPALDTLVDQLSALLGLHYGEADARVDGVRCGQPVLVQ